MGKGGTYTELILSYGRLQLGTVDAMYSDGHKYMPAITVRDHFLKFLPYVKSVLVLGGGMASIVHVFHEKHFEPNYTIVEANESILEWALEYTPNHLLANIEPVCDDAANFMSSNTRQYDLIFIDVFIGRAVPGFVVSPSFLHQCNMALSPGGHLALNYIINNELDWRQAKSSFASVFPHYAIVERNENRILLV